MRKLNLIILSGILLVISVFLVLNFFALKNPAITGNIITENVILDGENYKCPDCNVILISIDALRADHLGAYGYERDTSPNIDEFAKESIFFENAYSTTAWTFPSHFSIFTSRYPNENELLIYPNIRAFNDSYTTLTEILKSEGYETVGFTGGGWVAGKLGFGQGFDKYSTNRRNFEDNIKNLFNWTVEHDPNKKFFLFIHGYNCHRPYTPPDFLKKKFIKEIPKECEEVTFKDIEPQKFECLKAENGIEYAISQYDSEIFYVDMIIKEIFDELKRNNLYDNSIIIITSDHGEELKDHGGMDHINTLYQELIKVPLIIRLPNQKSKTINSKVTNLDLMPTLLEILSIEYNKEIIHGKSILPLLKTEKEPNIFTLTGRKPKNKEKFILLSVINKNLKFIIGAEQDKPGVYELYDLEKDPLEKNNLINDSEYESIAISLEKDIENWANKINLNLDLYKVEEKTELDEETLEQLRALGYMN